MVAQLVKNPAVMQETACHAGNPGKISGSGTSPGEGNGSPLQYSCLGNPRQRSLAGYSPRVHGVRRDVATAPPPPPLLELNIYRLHTLHSWKYISAHIRDVCRFTVKMCPKRLSITIHSNHKPEISQMPYEPLNE